MTRGFSLSIQRREFLCCSLICSRFQPLPAGPENCAYITYFTEEKLYSGFTRYLTPRPAGVYRQYKFQRELSSLFPAGICSRVTSIRLRAARLKRGRFSRESTANSASAIVTADRKVGPIGRGKGSSPSLVCSPRTNRVQGGWRVRCEPICGIWRYTLQASHNKLGAC